MPHITLPDGLPGITGPFAFRPETAKPMRALAEVLLRGPNTLSSADREIIATYTSSENDCHFCQTSHGAAAAHHLGGPSELASNFALISRNQTGLRVRSHFGQAQSATEHRRTRPARRQACHHRGHRARSQGRRNGHRDSRHSPDRRGLLHVQPLRGRSCHLGSAGAGSLYSHGRAHGA